MPSNTVKKFRIYLRDKYYYQVYVLKDKKAMFSKRVSLEKDGAPDPAFEDYEALCLYYPSKSDKYQIGCILFTLDSASVYPYVVHELTHAAIRFWSFGGGQPYRWEDIIKNKEANESFTSLVQSLTKQAFEQLSKVIKFAILEGK